ncbi:hypothetical protein, partial [Bifidobacterium adolescentis]|uniref:hypothetical protein n=1 Tax=Bifidobacterium adolescentis TaxID=1680 RepID=UPI003BB6BDD4
LKIVHRTRAMPASTSQRRTKPKVRRNSDVIEKQKAYETAADTHHIAGGKLDLQRSYKEYQNDMRRKK